MTAGELALTDVVKVYGGGTWLRRKPVLRAVNGVSLTLGAGETLGIVGESGSGKSTLGRLAAGIERPTSGAVTLDGRPFARVGSTEWRRERRQVQMVWQNPSRALDPRMPIAMQIEGAMAAHRILDGERRSARVQELLGLVGLEGLGLRFAHQLSGGQQQRAVIARALSLEPRLLICDEAVSALDVSVQAQIINLLADLKARLGISTLFISHDLGVVRHVCDRVAVMQQGRIVEAGSTDSVIGAPRHTYTQALIRAVPAATPAERRLRERAHA